MKDTEVKKRAHVYEVDLLRTITVFSVVTIHSLSMISFLITHPLQSVQQVNFFVHALHYNREMFMFVTGFVLIYSYFDKPFSAKKFWLKRFFLIFIPYVAWTFFYVMINSPALTLNTFIKVSVIDVFTGDASYQLYYILLTLQFYIIFPLFLFFLKKVKKYPWQTLLISLLLQLAFSYWDFLYVQIGNPHKQYILNFLNLYQDRLFITYQFFFIFGAFVALYLDKTYAVLKNFGNYIAVFMLLALLGFAAYFNYQLNNLHLQINYATNVLQPSVVLYSTVVIIFFSWIAVMWSRKRFFLKIVQLISGVSFGIFFIHVFLLNFIVKSVLPMVSSTIPFFVKLLFVDMATFIMSLAICLLLLQTPLLSWTIGRAKK